MKTLSPLQTMDMAVQAGALRSMDRALGLLVMELETELSKDERATLALTTALVSQALAQGHLCLELDQIAGRALWPGQEGVQLWLEEHGYRWPLAPAKEAWQSLLSRAAQVGSEVDIAVDRGSEDYRLLCLTTSERLYLSRYFHAEISLAQHFQRLQNNDRRVDLNIIGPLLQHYFADSNGALAADNRQALAAFSACIHDFCSIVGGPGTGKTTTVTRILAMLQELSQQTQAPLRIALAAPTGKAAARLMESIAKARQQLPAGDNIKQLIPAQASTLHRLLKVRPDGKGFRFNARNPLALDLLLIDEVSMVDVQLMRAVLDALPPDCRLILLGDSDQLASVEAGNVLDDLCRYRGDYGLTATFSQQAAAAGLTVDATMDLPLSDDNPPMADRVIRLTQSYRFTADSGIGHLARSINEGRFSQALGLLNDDAFTDIQMKPLVAQEPLPTRFLEPALQAYRHYLQAKTIEEALKAFDQYRVLCATREGFFGVEAINQLIEHQLLQRGWIPTSKDQSSMGRPLTAGHYHGRPIMVTHNDYRSFLFNGDIGLVWPDASGRLTAWFSDEQGEPRAIPLFRLPRHETVYAMTIHKSQGSEFDHCAVVLPDQGASLLTREIIYTGITRARQSVTLLGTPGALQAAIERRTRRMSGLADRLWLRTVIQGAPAAKGTQGNSPGPEDQMSLW